MNFFGKLAQKGGRLLGTIKKDARRLGRPLSRAIHDARPCFHQVGKDVKQFLNEVDATDGLGDVAAPYTGAIRRGIERATHAADRADSGARYADRFLR